MKINTSAAGKQNRLETRGKVEQAGQRNATGQTTTRQRSASSQRGPPARFSAQPGKLAGLGLGGANSPKNIPRDSGTDEDEGRTAVPGMLFSSHPGCFCWILPPPKLMVQASGTQQHLYGGG